MPNDQRLIEDYIPIEAISEEARREKSIRKGHISTLHLWWARRPLVAARAAVYGALVPAPVDKKDRKGVDEFVTELCKYPGGTETIRKAQKHILEAHAERLSAERGELVTVEDIEAGRAPRPRVLDMFAGGGAIPLEALRLGCEAYALDLNPVAHLIELCTLVYPQQFGKPDSSAKGSAADGSWAGLAAEVEHWGRWVLELVRAEIGDLYPPIPDPTVQKKQPEEKQLDMNLAISQSKGRYGQGMLTPVAYLWTRTVPCKNPECGATVPLARQTWLAKKVGHYVALQSVIPSNGEKRVQYKVVEASTPEGLGFDPEAGSKAGNVACPFCGTVADSNYVKENGKAATISRQLMVAVFTRSEKHGKIFLPANELPFTLPNDEILRKRIQNIENDFKDDPWGALTLPDEPIEANPRSMDVQNYGFEQWTDIFTTRQLLSLLVFTKNVRLAYTELLHQNYKQEQAKAIVTFLALTLDKVIDANNSLCRWESVAQCVRALFSRQSVPMIWDFGENVPIGKSSGSWIEHLERALDSVGLTENTGYPALVKRGSATNTNYEPYFFDAIVTDPPYYDNVSYSNLSDVFFVWLKRSVGYLYPEHFSGSLTPKKQETIAAYYRHKGGKDAANENDG